MAYLGNMKWYLDLIFNKTEGGMVVMPGLHRWHLGGNWKLAAEQFSGDNYHTGSAHESMLKIGLGPAGGEFLGDQPWVRDFEAKLDNGHGWINFKIDMAGGVPTKYMAPPEARTVGVIGSGLEATTNLQAVCAVRPIEAGTVFSPTQANRERFATRMGEQLDISLTAVDTPEAAVSGVDTVVVATNTTGVGDLIAYRGHWLETGVHVNSIGSTGLQLREIDAVTFQRAERIVVDSRIQMEGESGDLKAAMQAGHV